MRGQERTAGLAWWGGGSVALGSGIWSMHFVGMLAYSVPIDLRYTYGLTLLSWIAAVAVSGVALFIASRGRLTVRRLVAGSTAMAAGICAMHYTGMAAIDVAPGIVWNVRLVAASIGIAMLASAGALLVFFGLRTFSGNERRLLMFGLRLAAAIAFGLAISAMHYTGMAAASFVEGSICRSIDTVGGDGLGALVVLSSGLILGLTLFTSALDRRLRDTSVRLAGSLMIANEELQRLALHDALTGLPNRALFEDRMAHAVARHRREATRADERHAERLVVMFIDLDGFKPINDSFGHAAGDQLLVEAASRLREGAREGDTIARIGGDEFVLLAEGVFSTDDAVRTARRVVHAIGLPFNLGGRQVSVSCSVGIAVYPDHGPPERLLANADAAMYAAKQGGGSRHVLYEARMESDARDQVELQADLRSAVARGEFELHYQPKVNSQRRRIGSVEALLRWHHPTRGSIPPNVFIPMAERFGLIGAIGDWVVDEACRQIAAWADQGLRMRVAINVSPHQLRQGNLVERIEAALARHAVDPAQLMCEITESAAMEDVSETQRAFDGLARAGVFLSIDDFGTGYSSLSYLRQLPARQLKIDRSFIQDLETSGDARAVVDAVIRLSHALGLRVVAEGVETAGQSEILIDLACDELQGYFFAKPMSADALVGWARGERPRGTVDFSPSMLLDQTVFG
ncbi:EAL domain-containing protein [Schlegelella sp. ID0723]|uniref:EAL domain-containing protein n=2 Tax=Piscinibacter koreensis TaxID=2742824 RepID=A0A7Y6NS61_9BURK|nr:EAL domain-containing protein [Schlegelella koreensis]